MQDPIEAKLLGRVPEHPRACYLGTYDLGKPRNRIMLRGLRAAGYDVTEVHREVWGGAEDKSQAGGLLNTFKYPLLLAWGSLITGLRYLVRRPRGPIVVAYFGHLDLLPANLLALLLRRPLVFDLFLSMYDTLVLDRRLVAPDSLPARLIRALEGWLLRLPDAVICDTGERYLSTPLFEGVEEGSDDAWLAAL